MTDEEDLINNKILPDTVSRWMYNNYRSMGHNHKDAVIKTVHGLDGLQSNGIDKSTLDLLKAALFNVPGKWS